MRCRSLLCVIAAIAGCGDNLSATPRLEVTSPERGLIAEGTAVRVEGRAAGGVSGLFGVEVAGVRADIDDDGRFAVELELGPGTHRIETIAVAVGGATSRDVRSVSLGPRAGQTALDGGLQLEVGTVGLGRVAIERLAPLVDLAPVYAAVTAEPIAEIGDGCPRDVISVTDINAPFAQVFLYGRLGGLGGEILFSPIETTLAADYTDSECAQASGSFGFETLELHLTFDVELGLDGGAPAVTLSNEFRLYDHPLLTTEGDIDPDVFDRVSGDIELHLADALVPPSQDQYAAILTAWLASFVRTRSAAVGGHSLEVSTSMIDLGRGSDGIAIRFDLGFGGIDDAAWVPTPSEPVIPESRRAALAFADDAVDQLLGGLWAGGGLDAAIAAGTLEMLVPPAVSGDALVIGDWILAAGDLEIAVSGQVPLEAVGGDIDVALTAGEPVLEAQVLRGDIDPADLEDLLAEARVVLAERITGALSALSVPVAEAVAPMLEVTAEGGYLTVDTLLLPTRASSSWR